MVRSRLLFWIRPVKKTVRIYADSHPKYGHDRREREREVLFCAYKILRGEAGWAAEDTDEGLQVGSLVSSQALQQ